MSLATIYRMLEQQARLLSFVDIFRWPAFFGWLFRKVTHHTEPQQIP